ncbi:MAG: helix-turn-helix domain-containing protein [Bellilinea sp.]
MSTSPLYVRTLTDDERRQLEAGLRSSDAFVLRRCQMLLASARGQHAIPIAKNLGCSDQSVREVIKAFNANGLKALEQQSRRPHNTGEAIPSEQAERLKELLHNSPRRYGKATSLWTLELVAEVSFERGLTDRRVSGETIRAMLAYLGGASAAGFDKLSLPKCAR